MTNIFSQKKKQLYTPANMSMAQGQSSVLNNPVSVWGSQQVKPKQQSTVFSSTAPQAPKMSVAPKMSSAPKVIQGSGMSGGYASNPTNFKPAAPVAAPKVTKPQTSPAIQSIDSFLKGQQGVAQQKAQLAAGQYQAGNELRSGMYNLQQSQLQGMRGDATQAFNQFEQGTLAGVDRVKAAGERNKGNVEDYYGDAQRTAAQVRRETQGEAQRRFSNLNTIDSFGEGSFKQANENIDSDFTRLTQQYAKEKANKFAEIDDEVFSAQQTAEQAINTERVNLQQVLRQIDSQLQQGTMEYKFAQEQALAEYQDTVLGIEDWFNNIQLTSEQQKITLQKELDDMTSFTPEFMTTGVPSNQKEYEFLIKNGDTFKSLYPELFGDSGASNGGRVQQIIGNLSGMDTSGITGRMRYAFSDQSREAEGLLKQLSSELQLEEAKRLKGQGSMSDAERAILANAIAAFNLDEKGRSRLSDDAFRRELGKLAQQYGVSTQSGIGNVNQSLVKQFGGM